MSGGPGRPRDPPPSWAVPRSLVPAGTEACPGTLGQGDGRETLHANRRGEGVVRRVPNYPYFPWTRVTTWTPTIEGGSSGGEWYVPLPPRMCVLVARRQSPLCDVPSPPAVPEVLTGPVPVPRTGRLRQFLQGTPPSSSHSGAQGTTSLSETPTKTLPPLSGPRRQKRSPRNDRTGSG